LADEGELVEEDEGLLAPVEVKTSFSTSC
jgi:hypothetical protein